MDFSDITNFISNNVLVVLIALAFIIKVVFQASGSVTIEEHPDSKVVSITSDEAFATTTSDAFKESKLVIVDFYATWCGPCRTAAPIYGQMSAEINDVAFLKVDVDKNRSIMQTYRVRAMPTFVLLKNGQEVERVEGFREASIRAMINKHRSAPAAAATASSAAKKAE
eukprot:gene12838-14821_t